MWQQVEDQGRATYVTFKPVSDVICWASSLFPEYDLDSVSIL